jgi:hypothetical protein
VFDDNIPEQRRSRKMTILLVVLPLWLVASGGGALWLYFHQAKKDAEIEMSRVAKSISADDLDATMTKILTFIGERNTGSAQAGKSLGGMMSMIDGTLGPGNTGYGIERLPTPPTPAGAPAIVIAKIRGKEAHEKPIWVVTPCDSRIGSTGAVDNASGVAVTLSVARALAATIPGRSVYFAFVPHGIDTTGPVAETVKIFREHIAEPPGCVLVVERMDGGKFQVSSRDSTNPALTLGDLAEATPILVATDSPLALQLSDTRLPVALLTTQPPLDPADPDSKAPESARLAESAEGLKILILKLAERK